jgi:hypothetical protein
VGWFKAGATSGFAVNEPVRFLDHRFRLVKLDDDEFVAVLTKSPIGAAPCPVDRIPKYSN